MTTTAEDINRLIETYYRICGRKKPDTWQALGWATTELGEVYEVLLARDGGWVRNNPQDKPAWSPEKLAEELGDVIMMLIVAGWVANTDPVKAMMTKLTAKINKELEKQNASTSGPAPLSA